ncbi:MAG: cupin domain-containing protein [Rhodobacteraceae bacterium]|nr:cupin domain-containing protein [Paracoccaceae bacterium]
MTNVFQKSAFALPVVASEVKSAWLQEGFDFGIFRDQPGQEWNDFVHDTDEFVVVAEGELTIRVGAETAECKAGDLVCVPRGAVHSLKTTSQNGSVWFYGYGTWGDN